MAHLSGLCDLVLAVWGWGSGLRVNWVRFKIVGHDSPESLPPGMRLGLFQGRIQGPVPTRMSLQASVVLPGRILWALFLSAHFMTSIGLRIWDCTNTKKRKKKKKRRSLTKRVQDSNGTVKSGLSRPGLRSSDILMVAETAAKHKR